MSEALLLPAVLQAAAMAVDEGVCHRKRGLPRWERIGHPIDTLSVAACYTWISLTPSNRSGALGIYVALCAFSCLLVTKDEPVHTVLCGAGESWIHAVLFVLHPIVFAAFGLIWLSGTYPLAPRIQCGITLAFASYQILYWSFLWKGKKQASAA